MEIWAETSSLRRIAGKRKARLRQIERDYNVGVDIKYDIREEHETKITLTGIEQDVLSARDHIYDIVDEMV